MGEDDKEIENDRNAHQLGKTHFPMRFKMVPCLPDKNSKEKPIVDKF